MKSASPPLNSIFEEFCKIPNGVFVDKPDELIVTGLTLSAPISRILGINNLSLYFTRRSLKHLSEKDDGELLFSHIPIVLKHPCSIYKRRGSRILITKQTGLEKEGKFYVIVIDPVSFQGSIIVTSFIAKQKYLKNFEILWRTAASS